jgi:hypothetical protein
MTRKYNDKAKYWTTARIATLKRLHAKNLTASAIAAHMGASKNTITGKAIRLKLINDRSLGPNHLRGNGNRKPPENSKREYQIPSLVRIPPSKIFPQLWGQ